MSVIRELLRICEGDKQGARAIFGKTEEDVQMDLDILLQWLEKQPHLPKPHDKTKLEACLLRNKFRVEQTKVKIDNYYTYKGLYSDFFLNVDPASAVIQNVRKVIMFVPMPKLLPTMERLHFVKVLEDPDDIFNVKDLFTYILMFLELQLTHDYAVGERYVVDVKNFGARYILKMDPSTLTKGFFLLEKALSGRITAVEYINLPPTIDYILVALKRLLNAKLFNRIKTHASLESLYKVVPKEYLPEEYGGNEGPLSVTHEKWGKELIRQRDFLMENAKRISYEQLRMGEPVKNELFGVDGTFKKINLD